ncbi:glycosyltransferase, partial [Klebsiella pneumoniae]|uniref:glycosyltransferase n=1 Tax=Klebsiella pneumoniae TaxID=573 RepID=UPI0027322012
MIEDGKTGLLVPRGDPDGLANALAKAVADPDLRQRLGRAGRRWALTERSWDKVARRARKQIEGLLTQ